MDGHPLIRLVGGLPSALKFPLELVAVLSSVPIREARPPDNHPWTCKPRSLCDAIQEDVFIALAGHVNPLTILSLARGLPLFEHLPHQLRADLDLVRKNGLLGRVPAGLVDFRMTEPVAIR